MFIVPETVPTYLLPISMHVAQEIGSVMSLKKFAKVIAPTA